MPKRRRSSLLTVIVLVSSLCMCVRCVPFPDRPIDTTGKEARRNKDGNTTQPTPLPISSTQPEITSSSELSTLESNVPPNDGQPVVVKPKGNEPKAPNSLSTVESDRAASNDELQSQTVDSQLSTKTQPTFSAATSNVPKSTRIVEKYIAPNRSHHMREWTSKDGKSSTKATAISVSNGKVRLSKPDGKQVDTPIDKLSEVDRTYIRMFLQVDPDSEVIYGKVLDIGLVHRLTVKDIEGASHVVAFDGISFPTVSGEANSATEFLSKNVLDQFCWIELREPTSEPRAGVVYVDGRNINTEMLSQGLVRYDSKSRLDQRFEQAEAHGKASRNGVWDSFR